MRDLGANHPASISLLLPELLSLDPHFELPEPNMDDDCYVAVMIAVYNAAFRESSLITLFPPHTQRHYRLHRSRFPHLVPVVPQVLQFILYLNLYLNLRLDLHLSLRLNLRLNLYFQ